MLEGLSHLVYPKLCEGCNKPLLEEEDVLCLNCNIYKLPRTAYHHIADNETFMRFTGRGSVKKATSFAYFTNEGLLQHLLHRLKYEGKQDIGKFLGRQLANDLKQISWHEGIEAIIPIPLHPYKEAKRGFNQAEIIASSMSDIWSIPILTDVLYRKKHTESQTQKSREERMLNMEGAFELKNKELVSGKHVLLVDDVLTTGATLEACMMTLSVGRPKHISIATIGIAN